MWFRSFGRQPCMAEVIRKRLELSTPVAVVSSNVGCRLRPMPSMNPIRCALAVRVSGPRCRHGAGTRPRCASPFAVNRHFEQQVLSSTSRSWCRASADTCATTELADAASPDLTAFVCFPYSLALINHAFRSRWSLFSLLLAFPIYDLHPYLQADVSRLDSDFPTCTSCDLPKLCSLFSGQFRTKLREDDARSTLS